MPCAMFRDSLSNHYLVIHEQILQTNRNKEDGRAIRNSIQKHAYKLSWTADSSNVFSTEDWAGGYSISWTPELNCTNTTFDINTVFARNSFVKLQTFMEHLVFKAGDFQRVMYHFFSGLALHYSG